MQFYALCLFVLLLPLTLLAVDFSSSDKQTVVILLGPPASGKGTQAVQLSKALSLPHISTGDILRANIGNNTPLGIQAKTFMDKGQLVTDDLVLSMLFDRIAEPDAKNGYILDGFPRTLAQAEALEQKLPKTASLIVLNLDVSDDTITKRALGRKRSDDTLEVVQARLRAYHAQTAPLIDYYTKKGLLQHIDGEKAPDDVQKDLLNKLSSKK
jgi:adenylate kinase